MYLVYGIMLESDLWTDLDFKIYGLNILLADLQDASSDHIRRHCLKVTLYYL